MKRPEFVCCKISCGCHIVAATFLDVKCRVHKVDIFLVQLFTQELHGFAETLEVDDLSLSQEFDHIVYIGVVG